MSESTVPTRLRILVPMDFSESARLALRSALRLAQAPKDVVQVYYTPGLYSKTTVDAALGKSISQQHGSWRKRFLAWTGLEESCVAVEMCPQMGRPKATDIADMARRMASTLIVLSRRKYTFWERLSGGCPTQKLKRIVPCLTHFVEAPPESR